MLISAMFFFFFFQAEDGIRDLTVTGVQTCALPICSTPEASPRSAGGPDLVRPDTEPAGPPAGRAPARAPTRARPPTAGRARRGSCRRRQRVRDELIERSEERRVGKEGRPRGGGEQ